MNKGYVCIHGHFYQPPREDPWTREVPVEPSAFPFLNWNERICAECYRPFSDARILGAEGLIEDIVNLYSKVSFNAGPTLLSWLEAANPAVYSAMIEGDRDAAERFGGHGTAVAMPYYHLILPLCRPDDRDVVIRWGIDDFRERFSREPEGMWLPETAVDTDTLEALAREGMRFTILGPDQAARVRKPGGLWQEVTRGDLDTTIPYVCRLPSGKDIAVFFYDGAIASEIAFGDLLADGKNLAARLLKPLEPAGAREGIVNVAVDGETFGHHKAFGEMALAYAIKVISGGNTARITTYGQYLADHPPVCEVEVIPGSSWSCAHDLCRWKGGCTCAMGGRLSWSVDWREPLRAAMDQLNDSLSAFYRAEISRAGLDPEHVRNAAGPLVSYQSAFQAQKLLERLRITDNDTAARVLSLIAMVRHTLAMYSSDAWFFDDIGRLEPAYALRNAARAMEIARDLGGPAISPLFVSLLSKARGNTPEYPDGETVWHELVEPWSRTNREVALHYALRAVLSGEEEVPSPGFTVSTRLQVHLQEDFGGVSGAGLVSLKDNLTLQEVLQVFAATAMPSSGCRIVGGAGLPSPRADILAGDLLLVLRRNGTSFPEGCDEMPLTPGEKIVFSRELCEKTFHYLWSRAMDMGFTCKGIIAAQSWEVPAVLKELCLCQLSGKILAASALAPKGRERLENLKKTADRLKWDPDAPYIRDMAEEMINRRAREVRDDPGDDLRSASFIALLDALGMFGIHPRLRDAQDILFPLREKTVTRRGGRVKNGTFRDDGLDLVLTRLGIQKARGAEQ